MSGEATPELTIAFADVVSLLLLIFMHTIYFVTYLHTGRPDSAVQPSRVKASMSKKAAIAASAFRTLFILFQWIKPAAELSCN